MPQPNQLKNLLNSFQKGLFHNLSNQYWSLPNGIADLLEADDTGCVWFLFHIDKRLGNAYDEECPAYFRMYEKERDYYIEATGKVVLVRDPDQWLQCSSINDSMAKALQHHGLIARFKIQEHRIVERGRLTRKSFWRRQLSQFTEWLFGRDNQKALFPSPILSQ